MEKFRIFGAELSPYAVKVRSYFRYKRIPHEWVVRDAKTEAEFKKYAKLPIIPLVVGPDEDCLQDSTPIIERMEQLYTERSILPDDSTSRFVSYLLEEFGDEWGNKWAFHMRWAREEDCLSAGGRIAALNSSEQDEGVRIAIRGEVIEFMRGRGHFVGSNSLTGPQIEQSFQEAIGLLNEHLSLRPYLFGERPALADFGMFGQIYCAWTDPTGGAWIEARARHVLDWVHRMLWPTAVGNFEPWENLRDTIMPFLQEQVGALFIPWSLANSAAISAEQDTLSVTLKGQLFEQRPQKYSARSLRVLREKYAAIAEHQQLAEVLAASGCLAGLQE